MELFDSHFHYYGDKTFPEFLAPLERDGNRCTLLCAAGDHAESLKAAEFAHADARVYCACGVHPHAADAYLTNREDFSGFWSLPRVKAVGELGLDYFYDESDRGNQRRVFSEFLETALAHDLPAIVHCRDKAEDGPAYSDCYAMLRDFAADSGRFVVHCFTGSAGYAEKFLELGACLGVTGMVTFKKADNVRAILKQIPSDRLLIETDSPYLSPVPHRGEDNHPAFLRLVAARCAQERGEELEAFAAMTAANARRFYRIPEAEARP